jgi:hypothetical protein
LPESQKRFCTEAHEDHEEVPREESLKLLPEILDGVTRIFPTIALLLLSCLREGSPVAELLISGKEGVAVAERK